MLSFERSLIFSEDSLLIFKFLMHSFSKSMKGECASDCSHSDPLAHSAYGRLEEEIDKPPKDDKSLVEGLEIFSLAKRKDVGQELGRTLGKKSA